MDVSKLILLLDFLFISATSRHRQIVKSDDGSHKTCERYTNEPHRSPQLNWNNQCPKRDEPGVVCEDKKCSYNAEVDLPELMNNFITPNHLFFVRNHWPVPRLDPATYSLNVIKEGRTKSYSLKQLKDEFKATTITAAIQCGGNRRKEIHDVKPLTRLLWDGGAIGNAKWTGVRLNDILVDVGITSKTMGKYKHVGFEAHDVEVYAKNDRDPFKKTGDVYKVSIPLERVFDSSVDPVLLAYQMNGKTLPEDHGFPLRVVAPGIVGARNIKWLKSIELRETETESFSQRRDYKVLPKHITSRDQVQDWEKYESVQMMPVQSKICSITYSSVDRVLKVRGYAWSGKGKVDQVEVSIDRGSTWEKAKLRNPVKNPKKSRAWVLWKIQFPIKPGEEVEAWSKATDSSGEVQPDTFEQIWNLLGINGNAVSRMKLTVED